LPAPTPMTWGLLRRFLSGKGGLGQMYRDLGFEPDPALDDEGIYDLICGRPYCNLSREPGMYRQGLPLEHSFTALKADPHQAMHPRAQLNWSRTGWRFWLRLPVYLLQWFRLTMRLGTAEKEFAQRFRTRLISKFVKQIAGAANVDFSVLESEELLQRLENVI